MRCAALIVALAAYGSSKAYAPLGALGRGQTMAVLRRLAATGTADASQLGQRPRTMIVPVHTHLPLHATA